MKAVAGACAWTGAEMRATRRWIYELDDADRRELAGALKAVQAKGRSIPFAAADFPLAVGPANTTAERRSPLRRTGAANSPSLSLTTAPL